MSEAFFYAIIAWMTISYKYLFADAAGDIIIDEEAAVIAASGERRKNEVQDQQKDR
ncbi:MAG: hypothetical protein IJK59_00985 [Firmicutes bacterium]|nr:hypothetical protein [Bacillota bacterium]MBQ6013798.1 hypothetical protein [Bacillota bacterium]MBQ6259816.1 hypothetical protein [Bacillota bacterium]